MRAAVYVRISSDPKGEGLGVARQEDDCRELCAREGWEIVEVYADNDVSAYSGKPRPAYDRMLDDVRSGRVQAIVAWHPDRLHRSPRELEDFIDLVERSGVELRTVTAGAYNLATPTGRMAARIVGAVARQESEHKSERIRRKALQLAKAGKVGGGGTRPFGFEDDRLTHRPEEAEVIRWAVRRMLAGASMRGLCGELDERGVPPVNGGKWQQHSLRNVLTSPRTAGLRQHRGEVVGEAEWDPIITPEERELLLATIKRRNGQRRRPQAPRRYLLSGGLLRCSGCGEKMLALPRQDGRRAYRCRSGPGFDGCGKRAALAESLEEYVAESVLVALDTEGLYDRLRAEAGDDARLGELFAEADRLRGRIDQAKRDTYVEGILDRGDFIALKAELDARLEAIHAEAADLAGRRTLADLPDGDLREWWAGADLGRRRELLMAVLDRVELLPGRRGYNRFDPDRVQLVWRA